MTQNHNVRGRLVANIIKEFRKKIKISQTLMAKQLGISGVTLCCYEKNIRRPKLEIAYRIIDLAKLHGISLTLEDIYQRPSA